MIRNISSVFVMGTVLFFAACSKTAPRPGTQQATVSLKDGSAFAGTVTSSSPESITLQAPNGESRTYPMAQVGSVQYGAPTSSDAAPASGAPPVATSAAAPAAAPGVTPGTTPAGSTAPVADMPPAPAPGPSAAPALSPAPAPVPIFRVVPAGNSLTVRTNEAIDSKTAGPNQTFGAVVSNDVLDENGRVAIPRGSAATLIVRSVEGQGKLQGQSELAIDMDSVRVAGHRYRLETVDIVEKGKQGVGMNARTGKFIGGGTGLGALIGGIAGGGRGAAIGALSGAAAGTVTQGVTRGKGVHVPAETLLSFRLEAPVRIKEVR
jgi:hypothetical protein